MTNNKEATLIKLAEISRLLSEAILKLRHVNGTATSSLCLELQKTSRKLDTKIESLQTE